MQAYGGLIVIINYAVPTTHVDPTNHLITQSNLDILTQTLQTILVQP